MCIIMNETIIFEEVNKKNHGTNHSAKNKQLACRKL